MENKDIAIEMAAQLWCQENTQHQCMDAIIAEAAAAQFHALLDEIDAKDKIIEDMNDFNTRILIRSGELLRKLEGCGNED